MDNFLIIILIVCAILWWDGRKRRKATSKAWKDIGADEYVEKDTCIYKFPPKQEIIDTPKMSQEDLIEVLAVFKQVITTQTDDELIADLVDEELTKMPSEGIADAKSALKALGYKDRDIKKAVSEITGTMKSNMTSGEIVSSALRILNA